MKELLKVTGLDKLIEKVTKIDELMKTFPVEVDKKEPLFLQGPKLWQASTLEEEIELAEFEKSNQFAVDVVRAKVEDPLRNINL